MIKKYLQFIKESTKYEFGCAMIDIKVNNWDEIISFIDDSDLNKDKGGIEERPHLTLLYGLHKEVTDEQIKSVLNDIESPLEIEINGVDIFENDDFDVVKFNIKKTNQLQEIHDKLSELPNTNNFPDYNPHITIAYVKKGKGKKYIKPGYKHKINSSEITYSNTDNEDFKFKIGSIKEGLDYSDDWKKPGNETREMLERELRDILLEINDLGYSTHLGGFVNSRTSPYVWICNKDNGKRIPIDWEEIDECLTRLKDFFTLNNFSFRKEIINEGRRTEQAFIYFDKLDEGEYIKENKMWYKSIPEILNWVKEKSKMRWVLLDTETTGLGGPKKEQLTQISAIVCEYDFKTNTFKEIDKFDEKIKLTSYTKSMFDKPDNKTKWVLGFNHYGSGNYKYKEEKEIVDKFFDFINEYKPCLLVAQNAQFDMQMLGGRYGNKIESEVFDTKALIQLYFLPLIQKLSEKDSKYKEMVDTIGVSDRDNGLISSSMSKIGPALNVNMQGYHDALTDCRLMGEMYIKIIDLLKSNRRVDIMKYQVERIKTLR